MIGAEITKMDDFTLSLLTNREVLKMHKYGREARQFSRSDEQAVWISRDSENRKGYIALFNLADEERAVHCWIGAIAEMGYPVYDGGPLRELWTGTNAAFRNGGLACLVPAHGVRLFSYET